MDSLATQVAGPFDYGFEYLDPKDGGWRGVGFVTGEGDDPILDAFSRICAAKELPAGEYRYKRADERDSLDFGMAVLTEDNSIVISPAN